MLLFLYFVVPLLLLFGLASLTLFYDVHTSLFLVFALTLLYNLERKKAIKERGKSISTGFTYLLESMFTLHNLQNNNLSIKNEDGLVSYRVKFGRKSPHLPSLCCMMDTLWHITFDDSML